MEFVTEEELKNNLEHYLNEMAEGREVIIERDGKQLGRLVPQGKVMQSLTESLVGMLKTELNFDEEREKVLREKYGLAN